MKRMITRRQMLAGLGATAAAGLVGCHEDGSAAPDGSVPDPDAPPDGPPINACTATSAMTPEQLLAHVETIVVLCMENRSFIAARLAACRRRGQQISICESNVLRRSGTVHLLETSPRSSTAQLGRLPRAMALQANDGFVSAHAGANESDVMGYHVRSQIPVTHALADAGVVCNRWFAGCLGPTWPNRFYLHGATSRGVKTNLPALGFTSIFQHLAAANISSTNYFSDVAWATGGYGKVTGLATIERFFEDAAAGNLPPFAIIDPAFAGAARTTITRITTSGSGRR
jgi:phospholipase C